MAKPRRRHTGKKNYHYTLDLFLVIVTQKVPIMLLTLQIYIFHFYKNV